MAELILIKVLIVDDELPARELLKTLLGSESCFEVIGEAADGKECITKVRTLHPDLLFLDIQMPGLNGFEVLEKLDGPEIPYVVFVTAYDKYALDAFEYHALDYLLKPFKMSRFKDCLAHVKIQLAQNQPKLYQPRLKELLQYYRGRKNKNSNEAENVRIGRVYMQRVFVESDRGQITLEANDITHIEAASQYAQIHANGRTFLVSKPLSWYERELDPAIFVRIHRRHIVNLAQIKSFTKQQGKGYAVVLNDDTILEISRRRVATLKRLLEKS